MNKFCILLLLFSCFVGSVQAKSVVYYGDVGFISWKDRENLFPQSSKMLCKTDPCANGNLGIMAAKYFRDKTYDNFELKMQVGAEQIEGVIMAPMIARESVIITKDEDPVTGKISYIHQYRIFGSVVFFEFANAAGGRFLSSRPIVLQFTDVLPQKANKKQQFSVFYDLLATEKHGINLFKSLSEAAKGVDPSVISEKMAQVSVGKIGETVESIINGVAEHNLSSWKSQVAQLFESWLIKETGAPLIPSLAEGHLQDNLKATFANASYDIKLGKPAYKIVVDIELFKLFQKVTGAQKTICHAVKIGFMVEDAFEEAIMASKFKRTQKSCALVHVSKILDKAHSFQGSLLSLLFSVSKQFGENKSDNFLEKSSETKFQTADGDELDVKDQIDRVKELVLKVGL